MLLFKKPFISFPVTKTVVVQSNPVKLCIALFSLVTLPYFPSSFRIFSTVPHIFTRWRYFRLSSSSNQFLCSRSARLFVSTVPRINVFCTGEAAIGTTVAVTTYVELAYIRTTIRCFQIQIENRKKKTRINAVVN